MRSFEMTPKMESFLSEYKGKHIAIDLVLKTKNIGNLMSYLSMINKNDLQMLSDEISLHEGILISEFIEGDESIRSSLYTHFKNKVSRDLDFVQRNSGSFSKSIIRATTSLEEDLEKGDQVFRDALKYIGSFRTLYWTLDFLADYPERLTQETISGALRMAEKTIKMSESLLEEKGFVTFKQIELMIECLKIAYFLLKPALFERYNETDKSIFQSLVSSINRLFRQSPKLNRDLLFQMGFIVYNYWLLSDKEHHKVGFFAESHQLEGDAVHVTLISKCRSFLNCEDNWDVTEKLIPLTKDGTELITIIDLLLKYCHYSQINIKQNAFRVLKDYLSIISRSDNLKSQFKTESDVRANILNMILVSWEFPIRGFANYMEDIFSHFVKCLDLEDTRALVVTIHEVCTRASRRRYASLRIIMDYFSLEEFLEKNKGIVRDLFEHHPSSTDNSIAVFLTQILSKKYEDLTKGFKKDKKTLQKEAAKFREFAIEWVEFWMRDLVQIIEQNNQASIFVIIKILLPQIFQVCEQGVVPAIKYLDKLTLQNESLIATKVSLYKIARGLGYLNINKERNGYEMLGFGNDKDWFGELGKYIHHADRHIVLDAIRCITEPRKLSEIPIAQEYTLYAKIFEYDLKNSYPDFRNDLSSITKKLFQRLRNVMNRFFKIAKTQEEFEALEKEDPDFSNFCNFMRTFKLLFIRNVYPDSPFESCFPFLDTMVEVLTAFADKKYIFQNKNVFDETRILYYLGYYTCDLFEIYVSNFKSQWDVIRKLSFSLLKLFPNDIDYLTDDYKDRILMQPCKALLSSPIIKDVDAATYSYGLLYSLKEDPSEKFEMAEFMLKELKEKRIVMHSSFGNDKEDFSSSLYHGNMTALSVILGDPSTFKLFYSLDKSRLRKMYSELIEEMILIIQFATVALTNSNTTFILDNDETRNQIVKLKQKELNKAIEKLDNNTLLDARDEEEGDDDYDAGMENMSVVAFYLISKESGSLFAKLTSLVAYSESSTKHSGIFSEPDVVRLVENFTESLLSIKHLGARDSISGGLVQLCESLVHIPGREYSDLTKNILLKILSSLEKNEFKFIFRRSAGLPASITALLKSEPAGRRTDLLPLTMETLLRISSERKHDDVTTIHCLNILKFIFQDSQLKNDVSHYIGDGLKVAIVGFTDNDWSIRNSSLILYSAILNRLFSRSSDGINSNLKNNLNIIQFFLRTPNLISFFTSEIRKFAVSTEFNQYPSLYPICLIFSKLLPYDMKDDSVSENTNIKNVEDVSVTQSRVVLPSEIKLFKDLLLECAGHSNYLGRVLVARAIVPFIPVSNISRRIDQLISAERSEIIKDHNKSQGMLLIAKFVIRNFLKLCKVTNYSLELEESGSETFNKLVNILESRQQTYIDLKCTPITLSFVEIFMELRNHALDDSTCILDYSRFEPLMAKSEHILKNVLGGHPIRRVFDVCDSELTDRLITILLEREENSNIHEFISIVDKQLLERLEQIDFDDTNPLVSFFQIVNNLSIDVFKTLATKERVVLYLETLLRILNKHKRAINLAEHLIKFVGISSTLINVDEDQRIAVIYHDLLLASWREENRENMNLIQEVLPLASTFVSIQSDDKRAKYLEVIGEMLEFYSSSEKKDSLRYACVLVIANLIKHLDLLRKTVFKVYLRVFESLIELVTDEYAEIRVEASALVRFKEDFSYNANVALEKLFEYIFESFCTIAPTLTIEESDLVLNVIFRQIYNPVYEKYKYMALYESRIFNYDKPNKYREDTRILLALSRALTSTSYPLSFPLSLYTSYVSASSVTGLGSEASSAVSTSWSAPFSRSEYTFSQGLQRALTVHLSSSGEINKTETLDGYWKGFLDIS